MSDSPTLIWNDYTRNWCERKLRILRQIAELQLDVKELDIEGKAQGLNVPPLNKWLKAQLADELAANDGKSAKKIEKLVRDTQDQVLYGERLGHDVGIIPDNEKAEHLNGSKETHSAGAQPSQPMADKGRAHPPVAPAPSSFDASGQSGTARRVGASDGAGGDEPIGPPKDRETDPSAVHLPPSENSARPTTSQQPEHEGTAKVAKAANTGGDDVTASKAGGSPDPSRPPSPPSAPDFDEIRDMPEFLRQRKEHA